MNSNCRIKQPQPIPLFSPRPCKPRQFPSYRRRRLKPIANHLLSFDSFHSSLSQFLSQTVTTKTLSLNFLAPTLGLLASGVTLYLSRRFTDSDKPLKSCDIGEWILFTSPTPFNRFVILRCPTVSFEGSESLEGVNERLVQEDRHFVKLNSGRILVDEEEEEERAGLEGKLEYQRVCVNTEDGGVISLDWPANLDLEEEHGLDTSLLLVPGTPEGSMGANVRSFVCEALRHGVFPVVMNPRGCAGSPLTTARLFTAADSDDISTAIKFISKARPWTTMMGVGWGYGANMLTKYLAEVGERTPLTAATCINNPFDLEEATRCTPYHVALDQKLTGGLIDILRSNKELFQGRSKGFDVEKALIAKSVRDFEKAISMVSYGFEEIEDFYTRSSTRAMIGNVKIPVLFIQNDDGTVPLFSIPRSLIAENLFTSLLLCSCVPSSVIASGRAAVSWCQNFAIEWLTAVELGLLKGRHPMLKDVDVTINPSKGLSLLDGRAANDPIKLNKLLDVTLTNAYKYPFHPTKEMFEDDDNTTSRLHSKSQQGSHGNLELKEGLHVEGNGTLRQTSSVDSDSVNEEEDNPVDTERSQVLQTAQVVMNMLDVTMPGILAEEEKKKVLTAVGQGETLMVALQDAVPEDVREKLTNAASSILRAQQTNLKVNKLLGIDKISHVSSGLKSKIQEEVGVSSREVMPKDLHSLDQMKKADDLTDSFESSRLGNNKTANGLEQELPPRENQQNFSDIGHSQVMNSQSGDSSDLSRMGTNDSGNNQESEEAAKTTAYSNTDVKELGTSTSFTSYEAPPDGGLPQFETNRESATRKKEEQNLNPPTEQDKRVTANTSEEVQLPIGSIPESQPNENEGNGNQKRENKPVEPVVAQNSPATSISSSPTFDVVQALDALTGMDDSTQVAVNNVFGVIEDIISQMEEEEEDENDADNCSGSKSKNLHASGDQLIEMEENGKNDAISSPETLQVPPVHNWKESSTDGHNAASTGWLEHKSTQDPTLLGANGMVGTKQYVSDHTTNKQKLQDQSVGSKFLADCTSRQGNDTPSYINANPYRDYLKNENYGGYLISKIPHNKPLDLDTTTALLLDYLPEEGQWKLLEESGNSRGSIGAANSRNVVGRKVQVHSCAEVNGKDSYIETSYVVLDSDKQQGSFDEFNSLGNSNGIVKDKVDGLEESMQFVKDIIMKALKIEVARKLSPANLKQMESHLAGDVEKIANAVSFSIGGDKDTWCLQVKDHSGHSISRKVGVLHGDHIVRAISSTVPGTTYLRRVLPVGVIIGTSLAALRKHFSVVTEHDHGIALIHDTEFSGDCSEEKVNIKESLEPTGKNDETVNSNDRTSREEDERKFSNETNNGVMVSAVTAALGASALLMQEQNQGQETVKNILKSLEERRNHQKAADKLDEATSEKDQNNVVTSLAEKAMLVAAPVVPTKEDGEVDQERLVAMLADLGQKGGALRFVGKIALLWGGIRGAMSLTNRLISFLRLAERPLYQRVLGFVGMVLVLWTPVVIPLLPTLVQSWTTNTPSAFAELVCIVGLYTAVTILVMLWGRRIRGYEDPLEQYGLDFTMLPEGLLKGFIGGVMLVSAIQSVNALLGCVSFSWPSSLLPPSADAVTCLKVYGSIMMLLGRGIITAAGFVVVEELLFRSWLPEEIAADLGYHRGIIISGLAFSLFQRSTWSVPGRWLLSLALAGFRQRSQGSLSIPIGLRAGIMASSFFLQTSGFLVYNPNLPVWLTGTHPLQPFSGIVGLASSLLLAILVYPRQPLEKKERIRKDERRDG